MLHTFSIKYDLGVIKEYEKHMLTAGGCSSFLPMSFISEENSDMVIYNYGGYIPLADLQTLKLNDMLDTLEKVFNSLLLAGEHLINPSRVVLNCHTIYRSASNGYVRLAYVPSTETTISLTQNISNLISELEKRYMSRETFNYLEKIKEYATVNMSITDLITQIGLMKREIKLCGLN